MRATPKRRQPERAIQAQIVTLLRSIGASVYVLGTTRRRGDFQGTCQTPGLPDLIAFLPISGAHARTVLMVECKARLGRLSPAQHEFRVLCQMAGVPHVVGGLDDVLQVLIDRGHVRAESLPHYRQALA